MFNGYLVITKFSFKFVKKINSILIVLLCCSFLSCDESVYDPDKDTPQHEGIIRASTTSSVYSINDSSAAFAYYIQNLSTTECILNTCNGSNLICVIQKKNENKWELYSIPECVGSYSFSLKPDSMFTGELQIPDPGIYRLKFNFRWSNIPESNDSVFTNLFAVIKL